MTKSNHPIEQEELMAYLDGELETERASEAVAHLEHCAECQKLAADLKEVSVKIREWQITPGPETMAKVGAAVEAWTKINDDTTSALSSEFNKNEKLLNHSALKKWFRIRIPFAAAGIAAALFVAISLTQYTTMREGRFTERTNSQMPEKQDKPITRGRLASIAKDLNLSGNDITNNKSKIPEGSRFGGSPGQTVGRWGTHSATYIGSNAAYASKMLDKNGKPTADQVVRSDVSSTEEYGFSPSVPMVVRTAQITLTAKDFDKARTAIELALALHHGYIGELTTQGNSGAGRTLSAKLRVPADQLNALINEVRQIGSVNSEAQTGDEVTQQYVDLQARLKNARNTEQRLTDLLQHRTGKLSDVLEVEQEIDRVTGEIEEMEAERKSMLKQVDFASLSVTMNEEYKAPMQQAVPNSTSTRLGNAVVEGFKIVAEAILGFILFLATYGPILLLWAAILFFPVRAIWKRVRKAIRA